MGEILLLIVIFAIISSVKKKNEKKKKEAQESFFEQAEDMQDAEIFARHSETIENELKKAHSVEEVNRKPAPQENSEDAGDTLPQVKAAAAKIEKILRSAASDPETAKTIKRAAAKVKKAKPAEPAVPESVRPANARPAPAAFSGTSAEDAFGCVGGSMKQHSHEGTVLRAKAKADLLYPDETPATAVRKSINRSALRRAVIMSEILDKPKALRR